MIKRAQAAMEFLMTYGWAILVVLAAIAALAYFGVLSPDRFLPEKCTFPSGVACLDKTTSGTEVRLRIQNSAGFDMTALDMHMIYVNSTGTYTIACTGADATLTNGETDSFSCPGGFEAGKMKADINMTYTNQQTTMRHTTMGELIAKVN